ncbi:MAG: RIP metalloprotease RseP [Chlorobi bacterium]|nr:RIP metalloprotease RseP [Chlorobiota bacterium]
MDIFIKAIQLILSLSLLVILHEFGHFFFAKLFKTRVEKFYLFFNPWFSLFKIKKGETEYGIGWLPLGGYVKISGMIDESMDKEALKQPPQPWEFRAKPAWQRLLIMIGGVLVNFITAFVIFWFVLYTWGESYYDAGSAKYGFYYAPVAHEIGLKDGDRVIYVDTFKVNTVSDITKHILLEDVKSLTVVRGDSTFTLPIPEDFGQKIMASGVRTFAEFRIPAVIDSVIPNSPAQKAGIMKGDSIISVNGQPASFFHQFQKAIVSNAGKNIVIDLVRNGELKSLTVHVPEKGIIGVGNKQPDFLKVKQFRYGFWEAAPAGIKKGFKILVDYIKQLKLIFTKEGVKQLGGFGTMGNLFPSSWNWYVFWSNTALISLILAFMNILPIPALDGGHVLFLLYEIITGRKPSDKFLEYAQVAGMVLLLGLLLYANGNDIFKAFFSK